jgi:hypothetical protein
MCWAYLQGAKSPIIAANYYTIVGIVIFGDMAPLLDGINLVVWLRLRLKSYQDNRCTHH